MSYSFTVIANTKDEVKALVASELDQVVASDYHQAIGRAQAQALADSFIDTLLDDEAADISVTVSGSVNSLDAGVQAVAAHVSAGVVVRAEPVTED